MFLEVIKTVPWWGYLLGLYIALSAFSSLKRRIVWLLIALVVPILFLLAQHQLVLGLSHESQLLVVMAFLAGIGLGGSLWRPSVLRLFPGLRFEIEGDLPSAILLIMVCVVKFVAVIVAGIYPSAAPQVHCVSAVIGVFVSAVFVGRGLFLAALLR